MLMRNGTVRSTAGGDANRGGIDCINDWKPFEARCSFSASSSLKISYNHTTKNPLAIHQARVGGAFLRTPSPH